MKLCTLFGMNFENSGNISFKTFKSSGHIIIHDSTVCFYMIIESLSFNRFSHRLWPTWSFWFNFGRTRSPAQHRKFDYILQKQIFVERRGDEKFRHTETPRTSSQPLNKSFDQSLICWVYVTHVTDLRLFVAFCRAFFFFITPETINLLNWESQWAVDWWRCAYNTRCPRISAHNSTQTPRRTLTGEKKNFFHSISLD